MAKFGGLGGHTGGRPRDAFDLFENAIERALGADLRTDDALCADLWSSLANMDWRHDNGDTASYSFRAAGDLIAAIRGRGDYMDWYCSGPYATVSDKIRRVMRKEGWRPVIATNVAGS